MKTEKLIEYIRENPNIADCAYKLSMTEARAVIAAGAPLSFEQMIRGAMARSSVPEGVWKRHVRVLTRDKLRSTRIKIAAAAAAVVACLAVFFTAIPVGRAWANAAGKWIVSIFGDTLVAEPQDDGAVYENSGVLPELQETLENTDRLTYVSADEFVSETGLVPLMLEVDGYSVAEMTMKSIADGCRLTVVYKNNAGKTIYLHQTWGNNEGFEVHSDGEYFETRILNGMYTAYCNISEEDGRFECWAVLDDRYIIIGMDADEDTAGALASMKYHGR